MPAFHQQQLLGATNAAHREESSLGCTRVKVGRPGIREPQITTRSISFRKIGASVQHLLNLIALAGLLFPDYS